MRLAALSDHSSMQPTRSLPAEAGRRGPRLGLPIWSCSGWGLPSSGAHATARWSLTPPFHPYRRPKPSAVCLCGTFHRRRSCSALPALTTGHPALWSPDFPPAQRSPAYGRSVTPCEPVEIEKRTATRSRVVSRVRRPTPHSKGCARISGRSQRRHCASPDGPSAEAASNGNRRRPLRLQAEQSPASADLPDACRPATQAAR